MSLPRRPWRPGAGSTLKPKRLRWTPDPVDRVLLDDAKSRVYTRCEGRCEACGEWLPLDFGGWDLAHRVRRDVKQWRYHLSNLMALHRACHRKVGAGDQEAELHGFWLRTSADPTRVPLRLYVYGPQRYRLVALTEDGRYLDLDGTPWPTIGG